MRMLTHDVMGPVTQAFLQHRERGIRRLAPLCLGTAALVALMCLGAPQPLFAHPSSSVGTTGAGGDVGPTTTGGTDCGGGCCGGGTAGTAGTDGTSGTDGTNGTDGDSGSDGSSGDCGSGGGGGNTGSSGPCDSGGGCGGGGCNSNGSCSSATSGSPVYYRYGAVIEQVTDLTLLAPGTIGGLSRTYSSMLTGTTTLGNGWVGESSDTTLSLQGSNVALLAGATSQLVFTASGSTFTAPAGASNLSLTHNTTNKTYTLLDNLSNRMSIFNDFTVSNTALQGKPTQVTTLQWNAQGNSGFLYSYNTGGTISQITSPTNQDYNIVYTYSGSLITQITVKDTSGNALEQVTYTYYQNVSSPSSSIGSSNDLVQVQVSKHATTDPAGTMSIVRYTQYRYNGTTSQLKAVYNNDAIQRILTSTGLSSPAAIMSQPDTYGTPAIQDFASKSFTYYGSSPPSATNVSTPFKPNENLVSEYTTSGSSAIASGMVATETIGGCGGCGTSYQVTKNYYYMSLPNSTTDQNQVVSLVVEDTQDSAGNAIYRIVYGLENSGRMLRKAFIQNPESSPTYWCESSTFLTTGLAYRTAESRKPSAHTGVTTATQLQAFLNPYNGSSWANDTNTVNSSSGAIYVYAYSSSGLRTSTQAKDGESGTAYYVSASAYGDSVNPFIVTATYDYPTQTTTLAGGNQTSYSYTFYDSAHQQLETQSTTLPTVSTTQNGSGVATTTVEYYDTLGYLRWTQDGEGYINYYSYHPVFKTLAYTASDINPASPPSAVTSGSSGNWDAVTVGGANSNEPTRASSLPTPLALTTQTYYDELGRQTQNADTGGNNHYYAYANLQNIYFPFWNSTTSQCTLPIQITNLNSSAQISDRIQVRASYTAISTSAGAPIGFSTAPSQSDYVKWTHYTYDPTSGFLTYTDNYVDSPSSGPGTVSTDFYRTIRQYDTQGRLQYIVEIITGSTPSAQVEQVTQRVYDIRNRIIQVKKGVSPLGHNMTSTYNVYPTMYIVFATVYDSGGVGDGYATQKQKFFGTASTAYTGTNYYRTYRGHLRGLEPFYMSGSTQTPIGPYTVYDVDWKGRATTTAQYGADPTWSSVLTSGGYAAYASSTSTNRLTETAALYDNLNRLYQTCQYDISQSTGTGSNYLAKNSFYDRNSHIVASAPAYAAGTETAFDGAGRQYETRVVIALQSTSYSSSGAYQYCAPVPNPTLSSMSGGNNGVLALSHSTLDVNGNVLETDVFEDNHDDIVGGTPGINLTNNNNYVRETAFNWYDAANRITTSADYGSGDPAGGAGQWKYATIPSRPSTAPTASANTYLVTLYGYTSDSARLYTVTDPLGTVTKTFYDNLGRKMYAAYNWQNFVPPSTGTGNPNDRVTQYVWYGPSTLQQLVAMDPNGDGNLSDNQVTTYQYADPVDVTRTTSEVYPDSSTITLAYNVDGRLSQKTDPRGVVLSYAYTNNRLLASESATTLPSGVDGTVQSIVHTYDTLNRPQNVTSYSGAGGSGTAVNDIQYAYYDGFDKVATSYQQHYGAVNTSTSLNVQYTYDTTTTGSLYRNQLRLLTDVHPNGRTIYYDYGPSASTTAAYSATSTVREIWDGSPSGTGLAVYDYNGAGRRLAIATYPQPSLKLDHFEGTSGTYAGLDRFGRIVDQYWAGFGGTADVDRFEYAHDYAGNPIYRQVNPAIYPTENMDQAYTYDALSRLLTSQVGTLSGTTISGTPVTQEAWTLDGLANWAGYVTQASGTVNLNQTRTASPANEISGVSASVGATWATPAYDAAGNMTSIPIPSNLTSNYSATYDAWNRMVSLTNGSTTIATYSYDGLNRRVTKGVYVSGTLDHNEDAYYNEDWQLLELRKTVSGTINANPLEQYVWHPFYVDAPVLRDYDATCSGSPTRYYYTFDALLNVTAATTSSGSPTERYYYSPYGTLTFLDGSFNVLGTQASNIGNCVAYTGRQYDPESGLYHYRTRYYQGQLGCFARRDPLDYEGGLNLYEYVKSQPTRRVDPMGEIDCPNPQTAKVNMTFPGTIATCGQTIPMSLELSADTTIEAKIPGDAGIDAKLGAKLTWGPFNCSLNGTGSGQLTCKFVMTGSITYTMKKVGLGKSIPVPCGLPAVNVSVSTSMTGKCNCKPGGGGGSGGGTAGGSGGGGSGGGGGCPGSGGGGGGGGGHGLKVSFD